MSRRRFLGSLVETTEQQAPDRRRGRSGSADQSGSRSRILAIESEIVSPAKATRPVTISYSTHPKAQMSVRRSTPSPRACSGLMYAAVPTMAPWRRRRRRAARSTSRAPTLAGDRLGQAEVEHLHDTVRRDLDVRGLQVAVDDALVVGHLERVGHLARDAQAPGRRAARRPVPRAAPAARQLGQRIALDELEHQQPDAVRLPRSRRWRRCSGDSAPRACAPRARNARAYSGWLVNTRRQDLDRDVAAEPRVARTIDLAHATRAEQRQQVIAAEGRARSCGAGTSSATRCGGSVSGRPGQEAVVGIRLLQQRLDVAPQGLVIGTGRRRGTPAIGRGPGAAPPDTALRSASSGSRAPARRAVAQTSCDRSPRISRFSHAFASRQSPITVAGDTWRTAAVSSTLSPPKKRISITRLLRSSTCGKRLEGLVQRDEVLTRVGDDERLVERHPRGEAAALLGAARARVIHENAPHHPRRHGQEMGAVMPRHRPCPPPAGGTPR